ncbi:hypothetical protein JCM19314_1914 [Nonlabens ulvanivorans]|uniref:Uncharacterized protein n=1 Tax=Nonlabens ulvanivorans TaxID=906888 RepID=A0A090QBE9_NONUL|nr:hypothetical protein JCM19314_1914 [Nonlabens ulvanivorans]
MLSRKRNHNSLFAHSKSYIQKYCHIKINVKMSLKYLI